MAGRRVETDGHPGKVARAFGYRQQECAGANAQLAAKNAEGSCSGETASRVREIVVYCAEDSFRVRMIVVYAASRQE